MKNCQGRLLNVELAKSGAGISGGEACYIEIAKRLRCCTHEHLVAADAVTLYEQLGLTGEYHSIEPFSLPSTTPLLPLYLLRCLFSIGFVQRYRGSPDVVISHSEFLPTMCAALMLSFRLRVPWVAWLHMLAPNPFWGYKYAFAPKKRLRIPRAGELFYWINQRMFLWLAARFAARVIVTAPFTRNRLAKRLNGRIVLIPYGVEHPVSFSDGPRAKVYDALFVGRFHAQKGLDLLLEAWRIVVDKLPNAQLGIVGYGDKEPIVERVGSLDLRANISMLGFLAGAEREDVLRRSRIFVFPSTYESFGIVALEAMAHGLPVIAFDLPVFDGTLDSIIRVLFADIEAYAAGIVKLLTDHEYYTQARQRGIENAQRYSWDSSARSYEDVLNGLLASR